MSFSRSASLSSRIASKTGLEISSSSHHPPTLSTPAIHVLMTSPAYTEAFVIAIDIRCLDVIEGKIPTFLVAKLGHPPEEICIMWSLSRLHTDKADAQHLVLLRTRRERPRRRCAAECGQQFPPSDGDCHAPLPCEGA